MNNKQLRIRATGGVFRLLTAGLVYYSTRDIALTVATMTAFGAITCLVDARAKQ